MTNTLSNSLCRELVISRREYSNTLLIDALPSLIPAKIVRKCIWEYILFNEQGDEGSLAKNVCNDPQTASEIELWIATRQVDWVDTK